MRFHFSRVAAMTCVVASLVMALCARAQDPGPDPTERAAAQIERDRAFLEELRTTPEGPAPSEQVAPPAPPEPIAESGGGAAAISSEEAQAFVASYLRAAQQSRPAGEIAHYAEKVTYFKWGQVSRQFVARDQERYYKKWPVRRFALASPPRVVSANGREAVVRFRVQFDIRNDEKTVKGQVDNTLRLERSEEGLKIASIREQRVQ